MSDPVSRLNAALEGRYRIERELGEGGMSVVYLASDLRHERKVALKILKPDLAAVIGADRFLAEIRTTANLQHPNILPLFDSGEADGYLFYVMPYVEGESLRRRLDAEQQLPVDEAVRIASDVAEALDYAHRQGVIHRDIKPANILLLDGKPVISDFGIALAISSSGGSRLTETGLSLGTPHYMSPEQATGDASVGSGTDVWALGCVLYEMLTGEPPYTARTPQAILGRIITAAPAPVMEHRKAVPANVDSAIRRALEKVPADRFRTAGEFAGALRNPGYRHGAVSTSADVVRVRNRARASTVLAILLGCVLLWQLLAGGERSEGLIRSMLIIPVGGGPSIGSYQPIQVSSDGTRLTYFSGEVIPGGISGRTWTRTLSDAEPVPIPGTVHGNHFLSHDGRWVAFDDRGALRKVPVGGGAAETLISLPSGILGGDWSDDGLLVYATTAGLSLISADGTNPRALTQTDPDSPLIHTEPTFVPDGSGVVFTERGDPASPGPRIVVTDFDGNRTVLLDGHSGQLTASGYLIFGRDSGQLWAVRVASDWRSLAGEPAVVLEDVAGTTNDDSRKWFDISDAGTLFFSPRSRPAGSAVVWVDRQGGEEVILDTRHPQLPRDIESLNGARLSPDGSRIVFVGVARSGQPESRMFVYDLSQRTLTSIQVGANAGWPIWATDGERVLFNRFDGSTHDMYWARADNASPPVAFGEPDVEQQHPQWFSEDGEWVIVQWRPVVNASNPDLWLVPTSGVDAGRPLVAEPRTQLHASLSPDGGWLLYSSTVSEQNEIYVTEFPEPRTRVTVSTERGYSPLWSPRGDEIYYRRWGDHAMMVAPVLRSDSVFRAGTPTMLFAASAYHTGGIFARSFDVSADAQRFLMIRSLPGSEVSEHIVMIQNWVQDLERRLGG